MYPTRRSQFLHCAPETPVALLHFVSHSHPDAVSKEGLCEHVCIDAVHCYKDDLHSGTLLSYLLCFNSVQQLFKSKTLSPLLPALMLPGACAQPLAGICLCTLPTHTTCFNDSCWLHSGVRTPQHRVRVLMCILSIAHLPVWHHLPVLMWSLYSLQLCQDVWTNWFFSFLFFSFLLCLFFLSTNWLVLPHMCSYWCCRQGQQAILFFF